MKKFILLFVLLTSLSFGQTAPAKAATTEVPADTQKVESVFDKLKPSDAFLQFVLTKADKYSGKAEEAIGKAVDTATTEAPLLAKEYVMWGFIKNIVPWAIGFLLFFVNIILAIIFIPKFIHSFESSDKAGSGVNTPAESKQFICGIFGIAPAVIAVFSALWVLMNMDYLMNALECYAAPRVYIIEQLMKMLHK